MKLWEQYYSPHSVEEALTLLAAHQGRARIVAGGTDLLVEMRANEQAPHEALVDITSIPELCEIRVETDGIAIGAGVTHAQIVNSAQLQQHATCLVESCGVVGGPQVRNVATLGGNVAHALPAGDGTVSLVALDARAEVILNGVRQWLPLSDLYLGPGKSLLNSTRDLLIQVKFKAQAAREATAFSRIMRPQGVALPVLGCAVWVRLDASGDQVEAARVCIAPIGPTPARATAVEAALIGQPATPAAIEQAATVAVATLHPRTSKYRATAAYRSQLIAVLLERTLTPAFARARQHMES